MANLYAGPSPRWYGPAVNALLSVYLRVFEGGWDTAGEGPRPIDVIATRGDRARRALDTHATSVVHDDLAFGLAHLDVGRFER